MFVSLPALPFMRSIQSRGFQFHMNLGENQLCKVGTFFYNHISFCFELTFLLMAENDERSQHGLITCIISLFGLPYVADQMEFEAL